MRELDRDLSGTVNNSLFPPLFFSFANKTIRLPRQARDRRKQQNSNTKSWTTCVDQISYCACMQEPSAWRSWWNGGARSVCENGLFEPFVYEKRTFYQDRLGTNIGKTPKGMRFRRCEGSDPYRRARLHPAAAHATDWCCCCRITITGWNGSTDSSH
jgi:hypothetical protein